MKKIILLIALIVSSYSVSNAQNKNKVTEVKNPMLYIVKLRDQSKEVITKNLILNNSQIENLEVMKKDDIHKKFGSINEQVVITVTPKTTVKFIGLSKLFDRYKIDEKYWKLNIYVDSILVNDTSDFLIHFESVRSVQVKNKSILIYSGELKNR